MVGLIATQEKNFSSIPEARDYLRGRQIQSFMCHGQRVSFGVENNIGHIYIKGNTETKAFPIRETGMSSLLAKTGMGQGSFSYDVCDPHLLAYNLNYLLSHNVSGEKFTIILENGELKAFMSDSYSLVNHENVLDIIQNSEIEYKIHQLSLTKDFFRACITNPANKVEFKIDDISSVGVDIINSENGHASLLLGQYVYRYRCLNGASRVDNNASMKSKAIHRGQNIYHILNQFRTTAIHHLVNGALELERNFKILADKPVTESFLHKIVDKIQVAIGKKNSENVVDEWEKSTGNKPCDTKEWNDRKYTKYDNNRYDFAQLITHSAHRDFSGIQRLNMEKIGGYVYGSANTIN